jgi:membrane protein YqaA with SNARE-associated domain
VAVLFYPQSGLFFGIAGSLTAGLFVASKLWNWLRHLGGPGLLLLGLADNSLIPLPGSMDVLTIWFAVHHHKEWLYYAVMATAGSVIGGYVTYRLARKGGKETLRHRLGPKRTGSFYHSFERWGFWAIFVPALLPPPFPFVPFLLAAGALQYSRQRFLGALVLGRSLRYGILAYLGVIYGRHFLRFFNKYTKPTVYALVAMSIVAGIAALVTYLRYRKDGSPARTPANAAEQPVH